MQVCFVSRGGLRTFAEEYVGEKPPKLFVFGFADNGEVSYEKELKGETGFFETAARFSKRVQSLVVCGCITETLGHRRKSVLVAENGKLLGVSDMLHAVDGELSAGATARVYSTKAGRMGVIVDEDLLFPEIVQALGVCGCDFIVCPFGRADGVQGVLLRAEAYLYGAPILFCADGYCAVANVKGELEFASPISPMQTEFNWKKEYHLVETRRRGRV